MPSVRGTGIPRGRCGRLDCWSHRECEVGPPRGPAGNDWSRAGPLDVRQAGDASRDEDSLDVPDDRIVHADPKLARHTLLDRNLSGRRPALPPPAGNEPFRRNEGVAVGRAVLVPEWPAVGRLVAGALGSVGEYRCHGTTL